MGRRTRPEVRLSARGQGGPRQAVGAGVLGRIPDVSEVRCTRLLLPRRITRGQGGSRPGRGAGFQSPRQTESLIFCESKAPKGKRMCRLNSPRPAVARSPGRGEAGETPLTALRGGTGEPGQALHPIGIGVARPLGPLSRRGPAGSGVGRPRGGAHSAPGGALPRSRCSAPARSAPSRPEPS